MTGPKLDQPEVRPKRGRPELGSGHHSVISGCEFGCATVFFRHGPADRGKAGSDIDFAASSRAGQFV